MNALIGINPTGNGHCRYHAKWIKVKWFLIKGGHQAFLSKKAAKMIVRENSALS
jgi:hypothetical protein